VILTFPPENNPDDLAPGLRTGTPAFRKASTSSSPAIGATFFIVGRLHQGSSGSKGGSFVVETPSTLVFHCRNNHSSYVENGSSDVIKISPYKSIQE